MIQAKRVLRAEDTAKPDVAEITQGDQRLRERRQGDGAFPAAAAAARSARSSSATPSHSSPRRSS